MKFFHLGNGGGSSYCMPRRWGATIEGLIVQVSTLPKKKVRQREGWRKEIIVVTAMLQRETFVLRDYGLGGKGFLNL